DGLPGGPAAPAATADRGGDGDARRGAGLGHGARPRLVGAALRRGARRHGRRHEGGRDRPHPTLVRHRAPRRDPGRDHRGIGGRERAGPGGVRGRVRRHRQLRGDPAGHHRAAAGGRGRGGHDPVAGPSAAARADDPSLTAAAAPIRHRGSRRWCGSLVRNPYRNVEVVVAASHAEAERNALADLLDALGPDQPTLCEGWRTRELVAHLVLRERRPLAAPGIALPILAGYTARVQRELAARPYADLVAALRQPPAWSPLRLPPLDRAVNTMEMFIHHEDVRRGQPGWTPRSLSPGLARALWARARTLAWLRLRRFPAGLIVEAPGHGQVSTGRGGERVDLRGDPGELLLFLSGRQAATRVELSGPSALVDRLRQTR